MRAGDVIANDVSGESMRFLRTAADTAGPLMEWEHALRPGARVGLAAAAGLGRMVGMRHGDEARPSRLLVSPLSTSRSRARGGDREGSKRPT